MSPRREGRHPPPPEGGAEAKATCFLPALRRRRIFQSVRAPARLNHFRAGARGPAGDGPAPGAAGPLSLSLPEPRCRHKSPCRSHQAPREIASRRAGHAFSKGARPLCVSGGGATVSVPPLQNTAQTEAPSRQAEPDVERRRRPQACPCSGASGGRRENRRPALQGRSGNRTKSPLSGGAPSSWPLKKSSEEGQERTESMSGGAAFPAFHSKARPEPV